MVNGRHLYKAGLAGLLRALYMLCHTFTDLNKHTHKNTHTNTHTHTHTHTETHTNTHTQ